MQGATTRNSGAISRRSDAADGAAPARKTTGVFMKWLLVLFLGACGSEEADSKEEIQSRAEEYCRAVGDCMGTDESWDETCEEESSNQIDAAERNGCMNIMNDWYSCLIENSTCTDGGKYDDVGACSNQEELGEDCREGRI